MIRLKQSMSVVSVIVSGILFLFTFNANSPSVRLVTAATPNHEWIERIPVDVPEARYNHSMAYDSGRGIPVLFGGVNARGPLNDTVEFTGSYWVKRFPVNVPPPRYGHALAYDPIRSETVLFGGCGPIGDTWVWDGTDWVERYPANSPGPLCLPMMAFDSARGVMVLFGGIQSDGPTSSGTWEWDGTNWTERSPINSPSARYGGGMAFDATRRVVVLHGGASVGYDSTSDTWEWDGTDWMLRSTTGPPPRIVPSIAYDSVTNRVVMFGGQLSSTQMYGDTWEWDGNAGTWTERPTSEGPEPRLSAMIFDEARGVSVLYGGAGYPSRLFEDTWEWNGTSGNWSNTIVPASPPGSGAPSMAYDSLRSEVVLFGGTNSAGGTWTLSSSAASWTERQLAVRPLVRSNHTMAYDSNRGVTVLFGGMQITGGPPALNDTWEWDGMNWVEPDSVNSPPARFDHAMAYDSARGVIVLFGGRDGGQVAHGDTWEWDGLNWTQRFPLHNPPPRWSAQMAYDSVRGVVVIFGGSAGPNILLNDTWEWNGSDWILRTPANSPTPRDQNGLAYDSVRGVTVLFGGTVGNETWEWDGANWTEYASSTAPSGRYINAAMVYDTARNTVIFFGGNGISDDTWEYGVPGPLLTALGPAKVWIGLKNWNSAGIRFDLLAEVYKGSTLIGSGQLDSVRGGGIGFRIARLNSIPLVLTSPVEISPGDQLSITLYVRNACSGSGRNHGAARLWYNDSSANSHFDATIDSVPNSYYLLEDFLLGTDPGPGPKLKVDVAAGAKCSPFKPVGTWITTL